MCHSSEWEGDMDVGGEDEDKDEDPIGCARWNVCQCMNMGDNMTVVKGTSRGRTHCE